MAYEHNVSGYLVDLEGARYVFDDTRLLVGDSITAKVWKRLRAHEPLLIYVQHANGETKWENVAVNPDQVFAVVAAQDRTPDEILTEGA